MSQPTCETCRFFVPFDNSLGKCHRYPPSQDAFNVKKSDWCGEHKPKSRVTENLT